MTNTKLLKQYIHQRGMTLGQLANLLKVSLSTLSRKVNNKSEFKSSEIKLIQKILRMSNKDIDYIFFNVNVDFKSTKEGQL